MISCCNKTKTHPLRIHRARTTQWVR